jgi:hypothetical protein
MVVEAPGGGENRVQDKISLTVVQLTGTEVVPLTRSPGNGRLMGESESFHPSPVAFQRQSCDINDMIRRFSIVVPSFLLMLWSAGCCSSRPAASSTGDTTAVRSPEVAHLESSQLSQKPALAALARLGNRIKGTVLSVKSIDTLQYRLTLRVDSVFVEEDIPTVAEAGAVITLSPQYFQNDGGTVDPSQDRNKGLLLLKSAQAGDTVRGHIAPAADGKNWMLLDVIHW